MKLNEVQQALLAKAVKKSRKGQQEEREMKTRAKGLKSSQANKHKFEMPVEKNRP